MYITCTCIYHTVLLLALPFITVLSQIFYMSVYFKSMICLLSFWLFLTWRITFQFSLLFILPVHIIITLCSFPCWQMSSYSSFYPTYFILPDIFTISYIPILANKYFHNIVTFQFLSYWYLFNLHMTFLPFSCVPFLADICRHIPVSSRPWPLYTGSPFSCGDIYNGLTLFSHISQCWDIPQNGTQHHMDGHKASTIIALVNFFKNTSSNAKS